MQCNSLKEEKTKLGTPNRW